MTAEGFIAEIIYSEWFKMDRDERAQSRWVMRPDVWRYISDTCGGDNRQATLILDRPVLLSDKANGVTLESSD